MMEIIERLPKKELDRLQSVYGCSLSNIEDAYKSTMLFGRVVQTLEDSLKYKYNDKLFCKLYFTEGDGKLTSMKSNDSYVDTLLENAVHNTVDDYIKTVKGDVSIQRYKSCLKSLRLTGATVEDARYLLENHGVRYSTGFMFNNIFYPIEADDLMRAMTYCYRIKGISENYDMPYSDLATNNICSKVKGIVRVVEDYISNVSSVEDFNINYTRVLNFGSWFMGYVRTNYNCPEVIIIMDALTKTAKVCVSLQDFIDFANKIAEREKANDSLLYSTAPDLRSKFKQYGQGFTSAQEFYLTRLNISSLTILKEVL